MEKCFSKVSSSRVDVALVGFGKKYSELLFLCVFTFKVSTLLCDCAEPLQISTVTIEKDTLRQVVEELKRTKNDQSGKELIDGNILQVLSPPLLLFPNCFDFLCQLLVAYLQLQGLELSLSQKESCIKELESEINEAKMVSHHRLQEIELLNERLNSEARRIKSLERENDRLLQQISLLESKVGQNML